MVSSVGRVRSVRSLFPIVKSSAMVGGSSPPAQGSRMALRTAFLGVAHWHAPIYAGILKTLGVPVVGSTDLDRDKGAAAAAGLGIPFEADASAMLAAAKPNFVVVMPRHDQAMATLAPALERRLPMLIEKPMGLNGTEARATARAIEASKVWATAAMTVRHNAIWRHVERMRAAGTLGKVMHAHFRIVNGPPRRYPDWGVGWMLEPERSGGGALRNLGIHGADAFRCLAGPDIEVRAASLCHHAYGLPVEEFATALLQAPAGPACTIEAGYSYAASGGDFEWRIATTGAYFLETATQLTVRHADGRMETEATPTIPVQQPMVEAALADFAAGRTPACPVGECAEAVVLCDRIYAAAK
ncbi:MAG: Gfo/Idh/MocA family oxidoreductase [Alphaproteobacteria bacterium]|nr:Gfo/Idh/MocA family oxidoreductase [Alphaproteobacteria bacterium]